jgi:hypothetical protein
MKYLVLDTTDNKYVGIEVELNYTSELFTLMDISFKPTKVQVSGVTHSISCPNYQVRLKEV